MPADRAWARWGMAPAVTCLGMIHHLAVDDERYWFRGVAAGEPIEFPAGEDPGWLVRPDVAAADVFGHYREEIARANAIIATMPLDVLARRHDPRWDAWGWPAPGERVNLRWIVLHMIEETARQPVAVPVAVHPHAKGGSLACT
jgi:hypothetical protein